MCHMTYLIDVYAYTNTFNLIPRKPAYLLITLIQLVLLAVYTESKTYQPRLQHTVEHIILTCCHCAHTCVHHLLRCTHVVGTGKNTCFVILHHTAACISYYQLIAVTVHTHTPVHPLLHVYRS
jgi:hypothetical protein